MKSEFKPGEKKDNISVDAQKEIQKWGLLSVGIEESNGLFCLKTKGRSTGSRRSTLEKASRSFSQGWIMPGSIIPKNWS